MEEQRARRCHERGWHHDFAGEWRGTDDKRMLGSKRCGSLGLEHIFSALFNE